MRNRKINNYFYYESIFFFLLNYKKNYKLIIYIFNASFINYVVNNREF